MGRVFLMAGGGTGGHVIPGIAVARELAARGHRPVFVGTEAGLEARLVPEAGFPLETVEIGGLKGQGLGKRLRTLTQMPRSIAACYGMLRRHRAAGVFSMGGYAAAPVVLAAALRRVPTVLMEPNAMPGLTNRRLARFARRALLSFPEAAAYFPADRVEFTGLPVREEFFRLPRRRAGERITVLVTGGSRGARTLNQAAKGLWKRLGETGFPARVVLQCGTTAYEELARALAKSGAEGSVTPFIADMPGAFAEADLIVCRSGAGAVAELAAAGKPSVLIPYPYAADDHQARNAQALERIGAARMIRDGDFTCERLLATLQELSDPAVLERMGEAARGLAKPGAAGRAADLLEEYAGLRKQ